MDQAKIDDGTRFCKNCGNPVKPDTNFCSKCGAQIRDPQKDVIGVNEPQPNYIPPSVYQQQAVSEYPTPYVPQPYTPPQMPDDFVTPNQITEVREPIFQGNEIRLVLIMGVMGYLSHILRYLLIYNTFPSLIDLVLPLPIYLLIVLLLSGLDKKIFQQNGVNQIIQADTFDFTVSLVLSSFFLTTHNFRMIIDKETSTVPKSVYVVENTKMGYNYEKVPSATYIGQYIRPRMLFRSSLIALGLGAIFLYWYFNTNDENFSILARLVAAYLGGLALTNVSPRVGRYNEEMSAVGRYRTLFIFLLAFLITFAAILGESFFVALR